MLKGAAELPNLASRLGVRFVAGPLVNREHLVVAVVEAAKVEAVDQFLFESGIEQWNSIRVIPSLTLEEGLKELNKVKPIF